MTWKKYNIQTEGQLYQITHIQSRKPIGRLYCNKTGLMNYLDYFIKLDKKYSEIDIQII